jgi:DNA-binding MarR family transcriptional regulator
MAQITVTTTDAERNAVLMVLVEMRGRVAPVSEIAREAGLKQSRARYALLDLIESGRVEKVPHRAFNKHYVRYSYNVL